MEVGEAELEVDDETLADAIVRVGWLPGRTSSNTDAVQGPPQVV